eukprot:5516224-Amphidinium_carterae.1
MAPFTRFLEAQLKRKHVTESGDAEPGAWSGIAAVACQTLCERLVGMVLALILVVSHRPHLLSGIDEHVPTEATLIATLLPLVDLDSKSQRSFAPLTFCKRFLRRGLPPGPSWRLEQNDVNMQTVSMIALSTYAMLTN